MAPHTVDAVPLTLFSQRRLGDDLVEGWGQAEIVNDQTVRWDMTYRVTGAGEVLREEHSSYTWHPVRPDDIIAEAADAGLYGVRAGEDLVVLRAAR